MIDNFNSSKEFFASSNGYKGFISYFDLIFNAKDYKRLYILKGGPGTGKSTLMKKAAALAEERGADYEVIRCSSDINSLDGVIIYTANGRRVGIIDGTAPHMRDTALPGCADTLVDLGLGWDTGVLESSRERIEELSKRKKIYYAKAYEYMSVSSVFADYIKAEIKKFFDIVGARAECRRIISAVFEGKKSGRISKKLVSSFSDIGYYTLPTLDKISDKKYAVYGIHDSDKLILSMLVDELYGMGADFCAIPSPFDKDTYEAVYFEDSRISITAGGVGERILDSTAYITAPDAIENDIAIDAIYNSRDLFLSYAAEKIADAKKCHFELEKIYSGAMDFSKISEISDSILEEIGNIMNSV